ncbi:MAG TPA: S9 family peptidase [Chloroflexia bacterium]|nr:S9 family peptidase [Chloroflexia bacterium]
MSETQIAPDGSWKSPITSDLIVAGTVSLGQIELDGEDVYWSESRPSEGGRNVVVRRSPDGQISDVTPPPFNARTRVHEYGGGAYFVSNGTLYFSNYADQRLYRQEPGGQPEAITPEADMRYADGVLDHRRGRIICVREDHTGAGEAVNTLVGVSLEGGDTGTVLLSGNDFYSTPRISPDGTRLVWLTWNHPNMPWDGTELWVGEFADDGSLLNHKLVTGGQEEAIFQPEWSPDGTLYFVAEYTGWWNIYRLRDGQIEIVCEMEAEFGVPQWQFGATTYGFESAQTIISRYVEGGITKLGWLDTLTGALEPIETPYSYIWHPKVKKGQVIFIGGSPIQPASVVRLDVAAGQIEVLQKSSTLAIDPAYLSVPEAIEFPTENGQMAHAFYYAPTNPGYTPTGGELPPLLVISHGGPTSSTHTVLAPNTQFWTSRGFGVLDVNYGGSTGYGRAYRQRLNGQWGVVDLNDCVNGALYIVKQGRADKARLAIRGGSAGGYTTLCALTFSNVFSAGASYYGIADLSIFVHDTHKFESRYLERLVGPYPEKEELYRERSAINHIERLSAPVIFFQGLEDKVVPPNQAEMMVAALREKGVPVAYLPFEGEQHGFRRAENIKRSLDAELYFYSRIFGFETADEIEPVQIENL